MSKGILVFARNNSEIDYVKQAYFLAKQAKRILGLPTTVVTDSVEFLKHTYPDYNTVFDKVIAIVWKKEDLTENTTLSKTENHTIKIYNDGTLAHKRLQFKNETRTLAYEISPYEETLLLDTDVVIVNDTFNHCFEQEHDFLIYQKAHDLAGFRDYSEFNFISDTSVKFYWATCVFFRKTLENKIFFDLLQHIQENWRHYNSIFQINRAVYRNDHAFSIAIHIMNGYQDGNFTKPMPGKLFYTTDKDILVSFNTDEYLILLEKEKFIGEYTPVKFKGHNLHVMNKYSLNRCIDEVLND